ncbi:YjbE family integral membrane protein [Desmospora sp. 8437]|nr:YjbE family integral membrane protein [Desmospora sp. 8437]
MNLFLSILLLLISYGVGRLSLGPGRSFLLSAGVTAANYRGERVPTSLGGFLAVLLLFLSAVTLGLSRWVPLFSFSLFAVVMLASVTVAFLGWLDDTLGNHRDKGFAGHFRTLMEEGRLTTGLLKAVGGGVVAAVAATITADGNGFLWLLHTLLIGLMTNWLNLLDLRPGRALKFYLVLGGVLFFLHLGSGESLLFLPLLGLAAAVLKGDLSARFMLGDSGSNLLGIQLGIWLAWISPPWLIILLDILLVVGHGLGEAVSFTRIIENSRFLSYLDRVGRR